MTATNGTQMDYHTKRLPKGMCTRQSYLALSLSRCARRDEASGGYSVLFLSTHPSIYLTSVWWCVHWHWWPPALPIPQPPAYKMKHHDWMETVKRYTLTHTFTQTQITFNNLCVDRQIVCVVVDNERTTQKKFFYRRKLICTTIVHNNACKQH